MPDYDRLRGEAGFEWYVGSTVYALLELTGIPLGEYNLNPEACVKAYRQGRPLFRKLYHVEDVQDWAFQAAAGGASRVEVGQFVSPQGRKRFWDNWPKVAEDD